MQRVHPACDSNHGSLIWQGKLQTDKLDVGTYELITGHHPSLGNAESHAVARQVWVALQEPVEQLSALYPLGAQQQAQHAPPAAAQSIDIPAAVYRCWGPLGAQAALAVHCQRGW